MRRTLTRRLLLGLCLLFLVPALAPAANLKKAARALSAAVGKQNMENVRAIFLELGKTDDPKAADLIVQTLARIPPHEVMNEAMAGLIALGADNIAKTFDKALGSKKSSEAMLALVVGVAEHIEDERAETWLVGGVKSGRYFVYRHAIPELVKRRSKPAIPALIDLLEDVGFRPSTESYMIRDALVELTGLDFEIIDDWRNWWEGNGAAFDPKAAETGEGTTGVARKRTDQYKPPKFFGVEVQSNHVLFVIDTSGSMRMWDKGDEKIGKGADHQTRQRLRRVQHHLTEAVKKLPDYSTFNVISFANSIKVFNKKGSVKADKRWKKKAVKWVDALRPEGATHTDDAIREAFKDTSIDAIFLLTDGYPTKENRKSRDLIQQILDNVKRWNRLPRIKIFTFGFVGDGERFPGQPAPPKNPKPDPDALTTQDLIDFLTKLAEESGGKYTPIN